MAENNPFRGLTNEEILLIYHKLNKDFQDLESNLNKKRVPKRNKLGDGKYQMQYISISDEKIKEVKSSDKYMLLKDVVSKLTPIVDIIVDHDDYKSLNEKLKK